MKYFIFTLKWSQTDHTTVIIEAATKDIAQARANKFGARYADYGGMADIIIKA